MNLSPNEIDLAGVSLLPANSADMARWNESRRRRRMLEGEWETDVRQRISEYFSTVRELNIGRPALGLNLFSSVVNQEAILYDNEPTIVPPKEASDDQASLMRETLNKAHFSQLAQKSCRLVLGLRESLLKLVLLPTGLSIQVVPSDIVVVTHAPQDPSRLTSVKEGILFPDGTKAWEVWDITNPATPSRTFQTAEGKDITKAVLGDAALLPYPCIYNDVAFLPYVLYHAQWSNKVWNPYDQAELPAATLDLAVLWSMFSSIVRDASWPQRYIVNLALQGAVVQKTKEAQAGYIDVSPTSILCLKGIDSNAPTTVGQFAPGGDPESLGKAILTYQSVVLSNLGISPADLQSTAQAESGFAIQLKRSAQRREAKKYTPNFRDGDVELLSKTAMMLNSSMDVNLPVTGWGIQYNLPDLAQGEVSEELAVQEKLISLGLASKVDAYLAMHPEWAVRTRKEVLEHLQSIALENRALSFSTSI